MLVSFDGVGGDRLARLLEEPGKLPSGGFRGIAERGFHARRSRPPTPSLTAVSHVTHVTGALPEVTGIVSNEVLDPSGPFGTKLSGFDAPIRAETLWQAARRQGKKVGVILYPGADGRAPERSADWGINYVHSPLAAARLLTIPAASWRDAGPVAGSHAAGRTVDVALRPTAHSFTLVAVDTTDDGKPNYDAVRIEGRQGTEAARPGDWFSVEVSDAQGLAGAW